MCYRKPHGLPCYVFTFKKHYQREDGIDLSKMPRLSLQERHEAVGMLRSMTAAAVARHFGVNRSTFSRLHDRLVTDVTTGSVVDRRRSGRPLVTIAAEDRRIRTTHLKERFKSVSSTAREWDGGDVSRLTIGRGLRQGGIKCRLPCKKKFISNINRVERLRFATGKLGWTQQDRSRMIYSD